MLCLDVSFKQDKHLWSYPIFILQTKSKIYQKENRYLPEDTKTTLRKLYFLNIKKNNPFVYTADFDNIFTDETTHFYYHYVYKFKKVFF